MPTPPPARPPYRIFAAAAVKASSPPPQGILGRRRRVSVSAAMENSCARAARAFSALMRARAGAVGHVRGPVPLAAGQPQRLPRLGPLAAPGDVPGTMRRAGPRRREGGRTAAGGPDGPGPARDRRGRRRGGPVAED